MLRSVNFITSNFINFLNLYIHIIHIKSSIPLYGFSVSKRDISITCCQIYQVAKQQKQTFTHLIQVLLKLKSKTSLILDFYYFFNQCKPSQIKNY